MKSTPFLLISILIAAGCGRSPNTQIQAIEEQSVAVSNITRRLTLCEAQFSSATNQLAALNQRLTWRELQEARYESASIDLDEPNYARVNTDLGPLLIRTESVQPYLDGFKVKLRIGNLSAAAFSDFKIVAKWGRAFTNGNDNFQAWLAAQKTRTNDVTSTLVSGTWSPVELTLTPATTDELRQATVSIELSTVLLRTPDAP